MVALFLFMMNLRYTRLLLPQISVNRKYFKMSAIRELTASGMWNSVNQLSNVLMSGLDLLIANLFLGATASGEFAIAKTVPMFFQSFIAVLVGVFVPELMILYAQGKIKEFNLSLNRSMKFMQILMTVPMGFLVVYGDTFFNLWIPGQNAPLLHRMIILIILPMIITTSIETVFHVYTITNRLKIPALALLLTGVINITLMLIVVKFTRLGILAIPLVSLATGIIKHITFTPIYAARVLNMKRTTFYRPILQGIIDFTAVAAVSFLVKVIIHPTSWTTFVIAFLLSTIISFAVNVVITLDKGERAVFVNMITSRLKKFNI